MPQAGIPRSPGNDVQLDAKCRKTCSTGPARQNTFKGSKHVKTHAPSCDDEKRGKTCATGAKRGKRCATGAKCGKRCATGARRGKRCVTGERRGKRYATGSKGEKHAIDTKSSKSCKAVTVDLLFSLVRSRGRLHTDLGTIGRELADPCKVPYFSFFRPHKTAMRFIRILSHFLTKIS